MFDIFYQNIAGDCISHAIFPFHSIKSAAPFRLCKLDKKVADASNFLARKDIYSIYNVINKDMPLLIFEALNNIAPNYICSKSYMALNSHSHNTRRAAKKSSPTFFSQ